MAKSFRFRLQRVLDLREHELTARQRDLALALEQVRVAEARLAAARHERSERDAALRVVDDRPVSPLVLAARVADTTAFERREAQLVAGVAAAADGVGRARSAAIEARRQVEVMERLREKARDRWLGEIATQERRDQDDIQSRYGGDPLD